MGQGVGIKELRQGIPCRVHGLITPDPHMNWAWARHTTNPIIYLIEINQVENGKRKKGIVNTSCPLQLLHNFYKNKY